MIEAHGDPSPDPSADPSADPSTHGAGPSPARSVAGVIRALLAEPNLVLRRGIAAVLGDADDITVVDQVGSVAELEARLRTVDVDVVLLEPGLLPDGPAQLSDVTSWRPGVRVLAITDPPSDHAIVELFGAGVSGLLAKARADERLACAVRAVAEGGTFIDPSLAARVVALATKGRRGRARPYGLTTQQQRVLELLPRTNTEIARELDVSPQTVKSHLRAAMEKIGAHDRLDAERRVREDPRLSRG